MLKTTDSACLVSLMRRSIEIFPLATMLNPYSLTVFIPATFSSLFKNTPSPFSPGPDRASKLVGS